MGKETWSWTLNLGTRLCAKKGMNYKSLQISDFMQIIRRNLIYLVLHIRKCKNVKSVKNHLIMILDFPAQFIGFIVPKAF